MSRAPVIPLATLRSARRWMTAGLVISIVGTRIVEGGSDGAVASGLFPLIWLAILATVSEGISFAAPLVARFASHFNPATVLIASDATETAVSVFALVLLWIVPDSAPLVIAGYLLVCTLFPAVADVVEEFYAQQLAQLDSTQALVFNSAIYSLLAFVGLVFALPIGAYLAGESLVVLIVANGVLSCLGMAFRLVSARTVVTAPVLAQDLEDFGMLGQRMPLRDFLRDLTASGPASPLLTAVTQLGATIAGIFVYLWIAQRMPVEPATGLAIVFAVFGLGATVGPWIAPALRRFLSVKASFLAAYGYGAVIVTGAMIAIVALPTDLAWPLALGYVFLAALFSRTRAVLATTFRQEYFRGSRFASVMGWALALTAAGSLVGNWVGASLGLDEFPVLALGAYLIVIVTGLVVVGRFREPTAGQVPRATDPESRN